MSNIERFSVSAFATGSLEGGHAKTKAQAYNAVLEKVAQSFAVKLKEQNVKMDEGETLGHIYISEKNDAIAIRFRGKWFEVYSNFELLNAGVDPFVFSELTDASRIFNYEAFDRRNADKRPVEVPYAPAEDELMTMWQHREAKNKGLVN